MTEQEIKQFPLLANSTELAEALKNVKESESALEISRIKLDEIIKQIRKDCNHEWKKEIFYDKNISSCHKTGGHIGYGMNVLNSRTCTTCGLEEKRPKGFSTQICFECWSPMEYHSAIPGQGERTLVYECTNPKCNSGSWHT